MGADKVGKFIELPKDVTALIQAMCDRYGTTFTFEVVDALRRHAAYPPERVPEPLPTTPLPDVPAEVVPKEPPKKRGRKPKV